MFFILFYIIILPLIVINVVSSEKFITYFASRFADIEYDFIKNTINYIDGSADNSASHASRSASQGNNTAIANDSENIEISSKKSIDLGSSECSTTSSELPITISVKSVLQPKISTITQPTIPNIEDDLLDNLIESNPLNMSHKQKAVSRDLLDYYKGNNNNEEVLPSKYSKIGNIIKQFDLLSTLKKWVGIVPQPAASQPGSVGSVGSVGEVVNIILADYNLSNIEKIRIHSSVYDDLIKNIKLLINQLNNTHKISTNSHFYKHLKALENILNNTVVTQVHLLNLDKEDVFSIKELINVAHATQATQPMDGLKFYTDLYLILINKLIGIDLDTLREFYIINDFDYLNKNNAHPSPIYSKLLFEMCYCHDKVQILQKNNASLREGGVRYDRTLDLLCQKYNEIYNKFISKFHNINLDNYISSLENKVTSQASQASQASLQSREIEYFSEFLKRDRFNPKNI